MDKNDAPPMGETAEAQETSLPQHLTPEQQQRLRDLLDGKIASDKPWVQDTVADFAQLKGQHEELTANIRKAAAALQVMRTETASVMGQISKCIRDVTRWEIESSDKPNARPSKTTARGKPYKRRRK